MIHITECVKQFVLLKAMCKHEVALYAYICTYILIQEHNPLVYTQTHP